MADESRSSVSIRHFQGMSTDADRHNLGTNLVRKSVNVESNDPGVLRTRRGYREATFEGED